MFEKLSLQHQMFNNRDEHFNNFINRPFSLKSNNQIHDIEENHNANMQSSPHDFTVLWRNLSYTVRQNNKVILKNLSGLFKSGEITAVMGPSGAGKSTLLECICGRKKRGLSGDIRFIGDNKALRIAFVPQTDFLMKNLTVKESLVFASKFVAINNPNYKVDHNLVAHKIVNQFGLQSVGDSVVQLCSGGQQKRLSIAMEVVAKPDVLILDEPTTGLDSPSCLLVLNILKKLASDHNYQMAIVCTIHQPSPTAFGLFNKIYALSLNGECIYNDSAADLVINMAKVGLNCPEFNSPADYIIEIAAADYGLESISMLANDALERSKKLFSADSRDNKLLSRVTNQANNANNHFWRQLSLLYARSQIMLYRDPKLAVKRIAMTLMMATLLTLLFGQRVGGVSGCLPRELELWCTPLDVLSKKFETDLALLQQNICLLFFMMMIGVISGSAPVLLNFPLEMHAFRKEYRNGWYSCAAFFVAKTMSEIALQVFLPVVYVAVIYNFTGQPVELNREVSILIILLLLSFNSQSVSETISALLMDKPSAAVFIGLLVPMPMILLGGFMVKVSSMPVYFRPFSWFSFLRYAFEGTLVSLYGFGRCDYQYEMFLRGINVSSVVIPRWGRALPFMMAMLEGDNADADEDESDIDRLYKVFGGNSMASEGKRASTAESLVLSFFSLDDVDLFRAIAVLVAYLLALKIATYVVLLRKLNSKS